MYAALSGMFFVSSHLSGNHENLLTFWSENFLNICNIQKTYWRRKQHKVLTYFNNDFNDNSSKQCFNTLFLLVILSSSDVICKGDGFVKVKADIVLYNVVKHGIILLYNIFMNRTKICSYS